MDNSELETPLTGGNTNGEVVRVGDTVRRRQNKHSPTVHRLLMHLEKNGLETAPRFLGIDQENREILSFVKGDTDAPSELWEDSAGLVASAKILRDYHDATAGFDTSEGDSWAISDPDPARHEVICHNDFAPYNMTFVDGLPHGIIDFDLVGPGPRIRDLAYLAYWVVPLSFQAEDMKHRAETDLAQGSPRLKQICAAYGVACDIDILNMVGDLLDHMHDEDAMRAAVGAETTAHLKREGHLDHWQREAAAFQEYFEQLVSNCR